MKNQHIEALRLAVERRYNCKATHVESRNAEIKREDHENFARWVSTFRLEGNPNSNIAFAWPKLGDGTDRVAKYVIILGGYGVNSPEKALRSFVDGILKSL